MDWFMMDWLIIFVMWCSVIAGWLLAIVAEEEMAFGKKYFEWLRWGLFLAVGVVFGVFVFKNFTSFFILLWVLGVGLRIVHFFLKRVSFLREVLFELFCFVWATVVVLIWVDTEVELKLLFVSLLFMYGIVVGTLLNIKYGLRQSFL